MYILIDLGIDAVELAEPEDTRRFHVAVVHGKETEPVGRILADQQVGRLDPDDEDHVWVTADAVRRLAAGRVPDSWAGHLETMLEKAAKHGFYNADTGEIKAHLEWVTAEEG